MKTKTFDYYFVISEEEKADYIDHLKEEVTKAPEGVVVKIYPLYDFAACIEKVRIKTNNETYLNHILGATPPLIKDHFNTTYTCDYLCVNPATAFEDIVNLKKCDYKDVHLYPLLSGKNSGLMGVRVISKSMEGINILMYGEPFVPCPDERYRIPVLYLPDNAVTEQTEIMYYGIKRTVEAVPATDIKPGDAIITRGGDILIIETNNFSNEIIWRIKL